MPSKKRVYFQQFGIIHLPNPDLTYIRNSERETKLYLCPSPLENLNQEPFSVIYFFFHPPTWLKTTMTTACRARIFAHWRLVLFQVAKNCQIFCQTVGGVFLTFLPKIKNGNSICQTLGDALKKINVLPWIMQFFSLKSVIFKSIWSCLANRSYAMQKLV